MLLALAGKVSRELQAIIRKTAEAVRRTDS